MDGESTLSDNDLMRRCQDGDGAAFGLLVRRWEGRVGGVLGRLINDETTVQDLCQETFLRVYRARRRYRARAAFSTWVYRIAVNVARDHFRRRRAVQPLDVELPAPAPTPPDAAGRAELNAEVRAAMAALPAELLEALVLKHFGGLTFRQVGAVIEKPPSTAKSRVCAALGRLRGELARRGVRGQDLEP